MSNFEIITKQNCDRLKNTKEPWHWMLNNGINPRRKGWRQRAIGFKVPMYYLALPKGRNVVDSHDAVLTAKLLSRLASISHT